jgi:hypothetical protein
MPGIGIAYSVGDVKIEPSPDSILFREKYLRSSDDRRNGRSSLGSQFSGKPT